MTGAINPALFGMPDATTAGVPDGTNLTAYTGPMTITTPGTVIDGKIINGTLLVKAEGVVIQNCLIQNYGFWGVDASFVSSVTINYCTMIASSTAATDSAIVGSGTFIGNDISNGTNGIRLQDGASVVRDNYIHDLRSTLSDPHLDGIAVQGGQNHVLIEHNTVIGWDTSDIFIKNDFGPINDIMVRDNLLLGDPAHGDSTPASNVYVYGPNTTNVSIINNYMEKPWLEYVAVLNANPTISGNITWDNTIDPIPYPNSPPTSVAGSVSINDVTISEGNSGTKVETFTVTRSGGTAAFDVNYATSNGTATVADGDYVAASNTLHFGANQNTQTFSVTINGDTKVETNETFNVVLSNATNGATISDSQGIGTITNDDGAPIAGSVLINNVTISEGNSGTKVATFTVTRSGGTAAFDVNYATSNGTATVADGDYVAASNTLHFGANQNTQTFSVTVNGDTKVEANETFNVSLSNATNGATISDGQGVGTITNDDSAPTTDPVYSDVSYTLPANKQALVLTGTAAINGTGNSLNNTITGNSGNNMLDGGAGADALIGGAGNDSYIVDNAGDAVLEKAGEGTDTVYSTAHIRMSANVENLVLQGSGDLQGYGNDLVNFIVGNSGNSLLDGGAGADGMMGGVGNDAYFVDNAGDAVVENTSQGTDTVYSTVHFRLSDNVENLVLQGSADLQGYGNDLSNVLSGNTGNNILNGEAGVDAMFGGAGNDAYFVDNTGDVVVENIGQGTDTVYSTAHFGLSGNVENLILLGNADLQGYGNGLNNAIYGNSGSNAINGGAGADMLTGGQGNDAFIFDVGQAGGDTLMDFAGNGAGAGDWLVFVGYGPGATFTNLDATHWQINYNGGASHETITFSNAASIHSTDFIFI